LVPFLFLYFWFVRPPGLGLPGGPCGTLETVVLHTGLLAGLLRRFDDADSVLKVVLERLLDQCVHTVSTAAITTAWCSGGTMIRTASMGFLVI
jgi:hypothetical protein